MTENQESCFGEFLTPLTLESKCVHCGVVAGAHPNNPFAREDKKA